MKKSERETADFDCERTCIDSPAAYQPAAGAPTALRDALASARSKIDRPRAAGFALSRNDRNIIVYRQLLTTLASARGVANLAAVVDAELARDRAIAPVVHRRPEQQLLFEQR